MPISTIDGLSAQGISDGAGLSPQSGIRTPISCAYPLDAAAGEITGAGYAGKLTMTESDQTGAYTVQSGLGAPETHAAAPTNFTVGTSAKLDFSGTGKKAVEFQPQQFDLTNVSSGTTPYAMGMVVATPDFATLYVVNINHDDSNPGKYKINTSESGFGVADLVTNISTLPTDVAIVYDGTAGQVYVRYNGTNYATTAATLSDMVGALAVTETAGTPAGTAGNVLRGRLETQAGSFTGSYESGTTDTCGNTV